MLISLNIQSSTTNNEHAVALTDTAGDAVAGVHPSAGVAGAARSHQQK
jgi:hypothetical protein